MKPSHLFCWLLAMAFIGCQQLDLRSQSPDEDDPEDDGARVQIQTPLIGDYTTIGGLNINTVDGVGLVTGLDGTGDDPPPSAARTMLLEEMKKLNIPNPHAILQSPNTTLVLVRAYIPPLVKKGDHFDVEIRLPDNSSATSLAGGWLLECRLSEKAMVAGGGLREGHDVAIALGPVLVASSDPSEGSRSGVLKRGRIPGGAVSLQERDLSLYLRSDMRNVRNVTRIADRVGTRFHDYDKHGIKRPMAEAKTDQRIVLKLHSRYKENYPRYLQVIRNIAFREEMVAQRLRMQKLKDQLAVPETCEAAALQLEAVGPDAMPLLRSALKSPHLEVRFRAAEALAYLGDSSGIEDLYVAARDERAFRVYALAAMAIVEDAEAYVRLRELLDEPSAETRYGAFRALWTLDKNEPFIRGQKINEEFMLHVLHTSGEPMIHLTRYQRAEIVLFGADQQFRTPIAIRAGKHILVRGQAGSNEITVSRYQVGREDQRKVVSTRVVDVIRACAEMGATYPDLAQMLSQATAQHNAPGRFEMDAVPGAGRYYDRAAGSGSTSRSSKARVGGSALNPNLFPFQEEGADRAAEEVDEDDAAAVGPRGGVTQASAEQPAPEPEVATEPEPAKPRGFFSFFRRSSEEGSD